LKPQARACTLAGPSWQTVPPNWSICHRLSLSLGCVFTVLTVPYRLPYRLDGQNSQRRRGFTSLPTQQDKLGSNGPLKKSFRVSKVANMYHHLMTHSLWSARSLITTLLPLLPQELCSLQSDGYSWFPYESGGHKRGTFLVCLTCAPTCNLLV